MEEKTFNTFKEANDYAKGLFSSGVVDVRLRPLDGKFLVVASRFITSNIKSVIQNKDIDNRPEENAVKRTLTKVSNEDSRRLCVGCQKAIPEERLAISPNSIRCVSCQSTFEGKHDTRPRVDEGIAGTREDNKKMRGNLSKDMLKRSNGIN